MFQIGVHRWQSYECHHVKTLILPKREFRKEDGNMGTMRAAPPNVAPALRLLPFDDILAFNLSI